MTQAKKQYDLKAGDKVRLRNGDTAVIQGRLKGYGGTETGKWYGICTAARGGYEYIESWAQSGLSLPSLLTAIDIVGREGAEE